jgi:hypothetical protein
MKENFLRTGVASARDLFPRRRFPVTRGASQEKLRCVRQTELAWVAQLVERVLGKDEVTGSIPVPGSRGCGCGLDILRRLEPAQV